MRGSVSDRLTGEDRMKIRRTAAIRAFMGSYRGNVPGIIHQRTPPGACIPSQNGHDLAWHDAIVWRCNTAGDMQAAYEARTGGVEGMPGGG
ncbi:MAG: hypothetical protein R2844_08385 [Caldilineales bacterium]